MLQTLRPDFCEDLIAEATDRRCEQQKQVSNAQNILNIGVTSEWAKVLLSEPFVSSKFFILWPNT